MYLIYEELVQDYGAVTYEAFINLLVRNVYANIFVRHLTHRITKVDITEDQTSPEQLRDSFRGIASDRVC